MSSNRTPQRVGTFVCLQNFFRNESFKLGRLYIRTQMRFRRTIFTSAGLLRRSVTCKNSYNLAYKLTEIT